MLSYKSYKDLLKKRLVLSSLAKTKLRYLLSFDVTKVSKFTLNSLKLNLLVNEQSNFRIPDTLTRSFNSSYKPRFNLTPSFLISKKQALSNYYILYTSIRQRPWMRKLTKELV